MICYYCGEPAIHVFKNGRACCKTDARSCPDVKHRSGMANRGKTLSDKHKQKIAKAGEGREVSAETREKLKQGKLGEMNPMFGKKAWNSGQTKESDERIAGYAEKQTGIKRNHSPEGLERIRQNGRDTFGGENNPWYGKNRSKENSPRWLGDEHNYEFKRYRDRVTKLTEEIYERNIDIINPNKRPRTKAGVDGGYQLDHIIPVSYGFKNDLPIEEIAKLENLQMLPWRENIIKGSKHD